MEFNFNNTYVFIFFIYGLAFFSMGISALQQNATTGSKLNIAIHIKYLGCFGVIHGIMEWVVMIRIALMDTTGRLYLLILAIFLNAISFVFLLIFGIKLIESRGKYYRIFEKIPYILLALWIVAFIATFTTSKNNFIYYLIIDDIAARYFIGFPGGMVTAWALVRNARELLNLPIKNVVRKYYALAIPFATYGVLAGLVVEKRSFFPANIINKELFKSLFGFPVELGRALSALAITILFISIIDLIKWESNEIMTKLSKQNIISDERKKLGQELHDVVIQNLFATGLHIENIIESVEVEQQVKDLLLVKENLNYTIEQVRGFIKEFSSKSDSIEGLYIKLQDMIVKYESITGISIKLNFEISDIIINDISALKLTQLYYIVQEAVSNSIKHSDASIIEISITPKAKQIIALIKDNGKGFDVDKVFSENCYGLITMKERAISISSKLIINSSSRGTEVILNIPRGANLL
ncbi:sensor histidine kinase [Serpentinicella alkaliphila]|uniref:histidine kinase n=1 Tax=Serpentinicella alkaliphila TaxID=1734049 RepID=A0A4R2TGB4_9FIRM|nr:ATP-binding protein [Serpentinicella alkaliphila]QUH24629.1 hypothetical protein HZR23_01680 [Serpentinicella alkaliphila]TCQ02630.1 signal transduction histidine kinase [Serpentinicella alkaliphila]